MAFGLHGSDDDGETRPMPRWGVANVPQIFDRKLYRRRRERAAANFVSFDFLGQRAAAELGDRLAERAERFETAVYCGAVLPMAPLIERLTLFDPAAPFVRARGAEGGVVGDEEGLPFGRETLGLYLSCLTLHAVNDLPGAFAQVRAALKPG